RRLQHVGKPVIELAFGLERRELVIAADMAAMDEDLRDGAGAACAGNHVGTLIRIEADIDLLVVEALGAQQILCCPAIAAKLGGVEENARHTSLPLKCSKIISTTETGLLTACAAGGLCARAN